MDVISHRLTVCAREVCILSVLRMVVLLSSRYVVIVAVTASQYALDTTFSL